MTTVFVTSTKLLLLLMLYTHARTHAHKKAQPRFLSFRIICIIFLNKWKPFKGKSIRHPVTRSNRDPQKEASNKVAAATEFQRWTKSGQFSAFFFPKSALGEKCLGHGSGCAVFFTPYIGNTMPSFHFQDLFRGGSLEFFFFGRCTSVHQTRY